MLSVGALSLSACSSSNDSQLVGGTPTPAPSVTPTALPTVTPSVTPTVTPSVTPTAAPTVTPTASPTPTLVPMVYGVRGGGELVRFSPTAPGAVTSLGEFGIDPATDPVVGLDRRPADDELYAVSRSGRVFIVEVLDGDPAPTFVETELQTIMPAGGAVLPTTRVGVDFNPAANALRLVGDDGQNFRVPTTALANPAPEPPVSTVVDGRLGYRQGVTAAAYTNPSQATVGTELFVLDAENDALYLQNANAGEMTYVADVALDLSGDDGYDITENEAGFNQHYLVSRLGASSAFYRLDETTGAVTLLRNLPDNIVPKGMVVEFNPDPTQARLSVSVLVAEAGVDSLLRFNNSLTAPNAGADQPTLTFTGLMEGERLLGIDRRTTSLVPDRTNVLYGVTDENRVVAFIPGADDTLVATDAVSLTAVNSAGAIVPLALNGTQFGVDFNPAADLLRIVSDTGQNLRVNLQTGRMIDGEQRAAGFAFVDRTTRITLPDATDGGLPPQVVATAYRAAPGDGFQFAIDADNSSLARVAVPNDGALELVGPLGGGLMLPANGVDAADQGFDISGPADMALASLLPVGATRSALYAIDLETGTATLIGSIGATDSAPVSVITVRFE